MGIIKIDEVVCNGCGVCIDSCMMDAIRMDEKKKKAYIAYPDDCQTCFLCSMDCPVKAILIRADMPKPS